MRSNWYNHNYSKNRQRPMRIHFLLFCLPFFYYCFHQTLIKFLSFEIKTKLVICRSKLAKIPISTFASSLAMWIWKHFFIFVSTSGDKSKLGIIIIISQVKVPASLFSWPASNFLEHFYNFFSPFLATITIYGPPPEIYICRFVWICFS